MPEIVPHSKGCRELPHQPEGDHIMFHECPKHLHDTYEDPFEPIYTKITLLSFSYCC